MFDATKNTATEAQAYEAMRQAQCNEHKGAMRSSAKHCAEESARFFNAGMFGYAHEWACESLRYSVGILHPAYQAAVKEGRKS
jgi:hypothetical protein